MKTKEYTVDRDQICVGEVIKPGMVLYSNKETDEVEARNISVYRSMMFVIDNKMWSNDLLYESPSYPILNISKVSDCSLAPIVINGAYNLSQLLRYYNFSQTLTFKDILYLRRHFFSGHFCGDNCGLFGYKEYIPMPNNRVKSVYNYNDPLKDYPTIKNRYFRRVGESVLPEELWKTMDLLGNNSLMDEFIVSEGRMNSFVPHKDEGPILKLSKLRRY